MNKDNIHNRKLTWRHLKALNELYEKGKTRSSLRGHDYIEHLINRKKFIKPKPGNLNILEAQKNYYPFFKEHLLPYFQRYKDFFEQEQLKHDGRRPYPEEDILTLMFIAANRDTLKAELTTQRTFSTNIFKGKGSKYLEQQESVRKAVCKILDIPNFPEKDPKNLQWRFVVDCLQPALIVLCENINYLKDPLPAKDNNVELWYVGGNNTRIIEDIPDEKLLLPIYYSCDWDYHGLKIFIDIKTKLEKKGVSLSLLMPPNTIDRLPVDSPDHNSFWNHKQPLSGLEITDFQPEHIQLIEELISKDQWIEEEASGLLEIILHNEVQPNL